MCPVGSVRPDGVLRFGLGCELTGPVCNLQQRADLVLSRTLSKDKVGGHRVGGLTPDTFQLSQVNLLSVNCYLSHMCLNVFVPGLFD